MNETKSDWGVELGGADEDKDVWREFLKPPNDPYVEEVQDDQGDYLALRSIELDAAVSANDAYQIASTLCATLNAMFPIHSDVDALTISAVVEFLPVGQPLKHHTLAAGGSAYRIRGGVAYLKIVSFEGDEVVLPPVPSQVQLWMRAARLDPRIASAIRYLGRPQSWVDMYKAYEALKDMPDGGIDDDEKSRFRRTANAAERHHPNKKKHRPHPRPMDMSEGRAMIIQWIRAAIEDILKNDR